MPDYRILLARSAERDVRDLTEQTQARILQALDKLAQTPRPSGVRKLRTSAGLWRLRVGDYRVIYRIDDLDRAVEVVHVRHRRDAYR